MFHAFHNIHLEGMWLTELKFEFKEKKKKIRMVTKLEGGGWGVKALVSRPLKEEVFAASLIDFSFFFVQH